MLPEAYAFFAYSYWLGTEDMGGKEKLLDWSSGQAQEFVLDGANIQRK
jgi:hypothetical protein